MFGRIVTTLSISAASFSSTPAFLTAHAQSSCGADIGTASVAVGKAVAEIAAAVGDCRGDPTKCATDISSAVTELGLASQAITAAVTDCGGSNNPACAKDLTGLATDPGEAGTDVSNAVSDCKNLGLKCLEDVGGAAVKLGAITKSIISATKDCRSASGDGSGALLAASVGNFSWHDCGLPNATLHFDSVSSTHPVHTRQTQIINKTCHMDKPYKNITITYSQYWQVFGKWLRFLKVRRPCLYARLPLVFFFGFFLNTEMLTVAHVARPRSLFWFPSLLNTPAKRERVHGAP